MQKIKNDINGWLVIDKPYGMSSAQAVGLLKRSFHPIKIGHAGTLDPLATGVLPIAFGKATRTISFVMDKEKIYQFKIKFGASTTTDDIEGEIKETTSIIPSEQEIKNILPKFIGNIYQFPPVYSAIKVKGKRAYDMARKGKSVELKPRLVQINQLKFIRMMKDEVFLEVHCGKGTYVRSLGRDIAKRLGSCGHISYLRRLKCGPFSVKESKPLEKLNNFGYNKPSVSDIIPVEAVLTDILELAVTKDEARALSQGQFLRRKPSLQAAFYKATFNGELIAFITVQDDIIRPTKVFKQF